MCDIGIRAGNRKVETMHFIKQEAVLLLDNVLGQGAYGSVIEKLRADACNCTELVKF